ncbi:hypothetical protein ACFFNA_25595, partial [Mesorhizobium kowhaii]|uniref:hypothetical protein n=1 Tax=Mesorhizobium kowhaii TaxID=1300272 RepID=UPI0035EF4499
QADAAAQKNKSCPQNQIFKTPVRPQADGRFDFGRSGVALLHSAAPKHAQAHKPRLKRSPPPKPNFKPLESGRFRINVSFY